MSMNVSKSNYIRTTEENFFEKLFGCVFVVCVCCMHGKKKKEKKTLSERKICLKRFCLLRLVLGWENYVITVYFCIVLYVLRRVHRTLLEIKFLSLTSLLLYINCHWTSKKLYLAVKTLSPNSNLMVLYFFDLGSSACTYRNHLPIDFSYKYFLTVYLINS